MYHPDHPIAETFFFVGLGQFGQLGICSASQNLVDEGLITCGLHRHRFWCRWRWCGWLWLWCWWLWLWWWRLLYLYWLWLRRRGLLLHDYFRLFHFDRAHFTHLHGPHFGLCHCRWSSFA